MLYDVLITGAFWLHTISQSLNSNQRTFHFGIKTDVKIFNLFFC